MSWRDACLGPRDEKLGRGAGGFLPQVVCHTLLFLSQLTTPTGISTAPHKLIDSLSCDVGAC
jgi:hypothetical protein